ncbi:hypothetical protein CBR_g40414 [Chara braunii]|uniref:Uncharacterized protein n=1 Tax=Chara braunii TaxID=69332 RepID=A0A388LTZ6_CHABU|nr:hypothetical protein CBR_g40414 [Chara braunii]|eukprot:GBG85682.1 hypothetical protein CBR_g40414 [Chara braunii]
MASSLSSAAAAAGVALEPRGRGLSIKVLDDISGALPSIVAAQWRRTAAAVGRSVMACHGQASTRQTGNVLPEGSSQTGRAGHATTDMSRSWLPWGVTVTASKLQRISYQRSSGSSFAMGSAWRPSLMWTRQYMHTEPWASKKLQMGGGGGLLPTCLPFTAGGGAESLVPGNHRAAAGASETTQYECHRSSFFASRSRSGWTNVLQQHVLEKEVTKSNSRVSMDVPDFLPSSWAQTRSSNLLEPRLELTAGASIGAQLAALKNNNRPYVDHGIEVLYRFAGFDPFSRSTYFGRRLDLGQFERFRRIVHHSTYRVLLNHLESRVLSSLLIEEHCFTQRVWVCGSRPNEEDTFTFTLNQEVGGKRDGYWVTVSLISDTKGPPSTIPY